MNPMSQPAPDLPPIYFNHLFVVLDERTYRAIQGSDFLRIAFPGTERRTTRTAAGETWSGTYYYCRDTYLEFFGGSAGPSGGSPANGHWQPGAQEGWAGLAFSVSRPGGAMQVQRALQEAFHYQPHAELRQLVAGEEKVNWFYTVGLAERIGMGSFDSWLMEYHPDIFRYKGIPLPESGELTTSAYLSPWNKERQAVPVTGSAENTELIPPAPLGKFKQPSGKVEPAVPAVLPPIPPVFSNVIEATIHLDDRRAERYAEVLTLLGYAQEWDGGARILSAHGFRLRILPEAEAPAGYRLSALKLAMSRPSVAPMTFVFAPRSRLVLNEDQTADWFFGV